MTGALIKDFLSEIRPLSKGFVELGSTATTVKTSIQNFKTEFTLLNKALETSSVTEHSSGFLMINDKSFGAFDQVIRTGDLKRILQFLNYDTSGLNPKAIKAFSDIIGKTPEKSYKELEELTTNIKIQHPDLNITPDSVNNLTGFSKQKYKKIIENIYKYWRETAYIALFIGGVYVGTDWLIKATKERAGCYMITTLDNKSTSCKIQSYSCLSPNSKNYCTNVNTYYNTTIWLIEIVSRSNVDLHKISLAKKLKMPVDDLYGNLKDILSTDLYKSVVVWVEQNYENILPKICDVVHPDVENGIIPECRMCSPSAYPTSTTYIDPSQYPTNVTFQCISNPSILDVVGDVISSTGKNILEGTTRWFSTLLKPLLLFISLIFIIGIIIVSIIKNIPFNKSKEKNYITENTKLIPTTSSYSTM